MINRGSASVASTRSLEAGFLRQAGKPELSAHRAAEPLHSSIGDPNVFIQTSHERRSGRIKDRQELVALVQTSGRGRRQENDASGDRRPPERQARSAAMVDTDDRGDLRTGARPARSPRKAGGL